MTCSIMIATRNRRDELRRTLGELWKLNCARLCWNAREE